VHHEVVQRPGDAGIRVGPRSHTAALGVELDVRTIDRRGRRGHGKRGIGAADNLSRFVSRKLLGRRFLAAQEGEQVGHLLAVHLAVQPLGHVRAAGEDQLVEVFAQDDLLLARDIDQRDAVAGLFQQHADSHDALFRDRTCST